MQSLSFRSASVAATLFALTACSQAGSPPLHVGPAALGSQPNNPLGKPGSIYTCASNPPQNEWIFKGNCQPVSLSPSGGSFDLGTYNGISVKGQFGQNDLNGAANIYVVDAVGHGSGDIKPWNGKDFPNFQHTGSQSPETGVIYVEFMNSSNKKIKFLPQSGEAVWQFTVTDPYGFPGNQCTTAALDQVSSSYTWNYTEAQVSSPSNHKVTIHQYGFPTGLTWQPKFTNLPADILLL